MNESEDFRASPFYAQSTPGPHHGQRRCNLILISNPAVNSEADFLKIARCIHDFDPKIKVTVVTNRWRGLAQMLAAAISPTLIVSLVPLARFRSLRGKFLHGQNLSKSEEYSRLEAAGFSVPHWQLLTPDSAPDLSDYGPYVVTKPDRGSRGALVKIKRADRVITQKSDSESNAHRGHNAPRVAADSVLLAQKFIYTGSWPINFRVTTFFGKVSHSEKSEANHDRKPLSGPDSTDFGSIVATGKGCVESLNYDVEIIRYGEAAATVFPEIPLLGFDIVREVPSGKLYILEANAVGYVWHFSSPTGLKIQRENNINYESQFDGLKKASHILADKTQELAR